MSVFQRRLDILIYIAYADHEVGRSELQEFVTELTQPVLNSALRSLVEDGFLKSLHEKKHRKYIATDKTLQIFGD